MLLLIESIQKNLYLMKTMQELIKLACGRWSFDYPWDYRKSKKN